MQHILVVDDDLLYATMLELLLQNEGFTVTIHQSPNGVLESLEQDHYDLIVMEAVFPEMSGIEFCRRLRDRLSVPIIFVSVCGAAKDRIAALQAGADDYLVKPCDPDELVARTWALLRRSTDQMHSVSGLRNADLLLDPETNQVTLVRTGESVQLTSLETRLMRTLMSQPGRTMTREALAIRVWGYEYQNMITQLDVYISRLCSKLEELASEPMLIQTVRDVGYRFQPGRSYAPCVHR